MGANLRCGLWYCQPPPDFTCYFKVRTGHDGCKGETLQRVGVLRIDLHVSLQSTDGHTGQWQFNLSRLNAQVVLQAAQHGGCACFSMPQDRHLCPDCGSCMYCVLGSMGVIQYQTD